MVAHLGIGRFLRILEKRGRQIRPDPYPEFAPLLVGAILPVVSFIISVAQVQSIEKPIAPLSDDRLLGHHAVRFTEIESTVNWSQSCYYANFAVTCHGNLPGLWPMILSEVVCRKRKIKWSYRWWHRAAQFSLRLSRNRSCRWGVLPSVLTMKASAKPLSLRCCVDFDGAGCVLLVVHLGSVVLKANAQGHRRWC